MTTSTTMMMMMKKRKREINNSIVRSLFLLFFLRRRFCDFHLVSALSGLVLLFGGALTIFFLPQRHQFLHPRHSLLFDNGRAGGKALALESKLETGMGFHVPAGGGSWGLNLWTTRMSGSFYGCSNSTEKFQKADVRTHPNRYLLIATSGGLNQQRTGITDAVVAAYILNATLVVPWLDQKSYWKDSSNFAEIFDVEWFISLLSKHVKIIKQLPATEGKIITPYTMRVPRKCTPKCYHNRVLPALNKKHAVQLTKFDYRLSNRLDKHLQKLRCRVNYHALRFTDPIQDMGKMLVDRMRMKSNHFIALHLRFEPDMLAFSGCYFGGGEKEKSELGAIRKRWKTLHTSNPNKERRHGRCPLTPEEVGLMLRALGFGSDVHIYVASGEVYGGEETLASLKALFPNFHSKETIASNEELAPFSPFSSRMAALDFIVCDESDVFVTNNNGNMARILAGRRRYFGHKPTIRPNAKKLYKLFMTRNNMTWEEFTSRIRTNQIGFMGEPNEVRPGTGEFHENPAACICEVSKAKPNGVSSAGQTQRQTYDNHVGDDDHELNLFDTDYAVPNETFSGSLRKPHQPRQPELEELFSD